MLETVLQQLTTAQLMISGVKFAIKLYPDYSGEVISLYWDGTEKVQAYLIDEPSSLAGFLVTGNDELKDIMADELYDVVSVMKQATPNPFFPGEIPYMVFFGDGSGTIQMEAKPQALKTFSNVEDAVDWFRENKVR